MATVQEQKQKEKEALLKEERRELEAKISEKLPPEFGESSKTKVEVYEEPLEVEPEMIKPIIESVLFVASKPLGLNELKRVIKGVKVGDIKAAIDELAGEYNERKSSFSLQEVAGGFEISTRPQFAPWIMKLELEKKKRQATQSTLETLAILAYKQPITRVEIEELRGVNASGILSTLLDRNLIKIVGRKEIPGRPMLYGTTDKFLEHFGLKGLGELPNISEIKDLVQRMVTQEELMVEEEQKAKEANKEGQSEEKEPEVVLPSAEERRQVLDEVSEVIKNTNTKFVVPQEEKDESEETSEEVPEEN